MSKLRPTMTQVFAFSLICLMLGLAFLFYLVVRGSGRTILHSADTDRDLASHEVAARVIEYLGEAPLAVDHFQQQVRYNLIQPRDPDSAESALLSLLLAPLYGWLLLVSAWARSRLERSCSPAQIAGCPIR